MSVFECTDQLTFSQMAQNEFSVYKAEEGGDAVASLTDDTKELKLLVAGNSGKLFGEM